MTTDLQTRFDVLCAITRAQHFAWRQAVVDLCPDVDPEAVVNRMWEVTGEGTAAAYLKRIDRSKPIAPQIAAGIVWSSDCMGEDATAERPDGAAAAGGDEAWVCHSDCPWFHWHEKQDLLAEDRPGCDAWFGSTIDHVNRALGTRLRFETLEALPDGGARCVRRIWNEE